MKRQNKRKRHTQNRSAKLIVRSAAVGGWDVVAILLARPTPDGNTQTRLHNLMGQGNEEWVADQLAEHAQMLTISTTKKIETNSPGVTDERNDDPVSPEADPSKPEQAGGAVPPSPEEGKSKQATGPPSPNDHAASKPGSDQGLG